MKKYFLPVLLSSAYLTSCQAAIKIESKECLAIFVTKQAELKALRADLVSFADQLNLLVDFAFGDTVSVHIRKGREDLIRLSLYSPQSKRPVEFNVFVYKEGQEYYLKKIDEFIEKTLKPNYEIKACKDVPDFYPSVEYR